MPYAQAYSRNLSRSRGSIFSGIGRALGTVGRVVASVPGLGVAGGAMQTIGRTIAPPRVSATVASVAPGGLRLTGPSFSVGKGGVSAAGPALSIAGMGGRGGVRKGRRMNAGNARAARRAIRRIKSVRQLLQSIERELPRRPAARASRGVITRSEAARALRS